MTSPHFLARDGSLRVDVARCPCCGSASPDGKCANEFHTRPDVGVKE